MVLYVSGTSNPPAAPRLYPTPLDAAQGPIASQGFTALFLGETSKEGMGLGVGLRGNWERP
ncbi:hypothetical protein MCOR19_004366 [Pyricularia oryzae]|uniref:Uncharacterized protein n=1 Tax=Pyricularia grisea TaxID=148305 RepID=A0ABQ8NK20_PYRGI|nr:hypothetical protein MCOR19_004366 [Pyricularia oryzae]KAI6298316.1 hypothetical protein MCOR33_005545 [Pyricularia grisea]KAI6496247.1 hypothetical protein MCOR18_000671 [Pyricularia oryzae]